MVSEVKACIDQFNKATDLMDKYSLEQANASPTTDSDLAAGVLQGDMDLATLKGDIRMGATGFTDASTSTFKILSEIGIDSEESSGGVVSDHLTLDENKLRTALGQNRGDVSKLLSDFADNMSSNLQSQTNVSTIQADAGAFYSRILGIDDQVNHIDDSISTWEDRVSAEETRLRASFTQMEETLQQLQTQSSYITNQLSSLSKASSSSSSSSSSS